MYLFTKKLFIIFIFLFSITAMSSVIEDGTLQIGKTGVDTIINLSGGDGALKYDVGTNKVQAAHNGSTFFNLGEAIVSDPSEFNGVTNAQAEVDTAGWVIYADAAGSSPVDGTGGSPNITFPRETSVPLRQTGSFKIVKDAVNRQGEGVSFDFTLDKADLGHEITIRFDYTVSANYADDDISIFVFNKDTPGLVTIFQNQPVKDSSDQHTVSFLSDGTDDDYRLIFHIASVNALAYDFTFDNVKVRRFDPESTATHKDGRKFSIVSAKWNGAGGTPAIIADSDYPLGWLTLNTDIGVGAWLLDIATGTFSDTPNCSATSQFATAVICQMNPATAPSATVIRIDCFRDTGAAVDTIFSITCHGPKQ